MSCAVNSRISSEEASLFLQEVVPTYFPDGDIPLFVCLTKKQYEHPMEHTVKLNLTDDIATRVKQYVVIICGKAEAEEYIQKQKKKAAAAAKKRKRASSR